MIVAGQFTHILLRVVSFNLPHRHQKLLQIQRIIKAHYSYNYAQMIDYLVKCCKILILRGYCNNNVRMSEFEPQKHLGKILLDFFNKPLWKHQLNTIIPT